jgi:hypothetical protein
MDNATDRDEPPSWIDPDMERALRVVVPHVMPTRAVALYARWWQLETWLRELTYVELRALFGVSWVDAIKAASGRQAQDAAYTHMTGADNDNPLAYVDYSQLVDVISAHWGQIGYALLEQGSWQGRQDELKRIRHRIGHLRKPHDDDLGRLEQTLRDLERGAFVALASYNRRFAPDPEKHLDPVTDGWIREQHPTALRLLRHADRQYETRLHVQVSRRPWASWPPDLLGAPGILWHADFRMRGRTIDARTLWHESALNAVRPLVVHMLSNDPWHVGFTFSGVDDPVAVSDAIGKAFDVVLMVSEAGIIEDEHWDRWRRRARDVNYRVLSGSGWNIVDETTVPISHFGSGGGVESAPDW